MIVKADGLTKEEVQRFDEVARKNEMNRAEYLRYLIRNITSLPEALDGEARLKAILDDVLFHLDLNTKVLMKNIETNLLPPLIDEQPREGSDRL